MLMRVTCGVGYLCVGRSAYSSGGSSVWSVIGAGVLVIASHHPVSPVMRLIVRSVVMVASGCVSVNPVFPRGVSMCVLVSGLVIFVSSTYSNVHVTLI